MGIIPQPVHLQSNPGQFELADGLSIGFTGEGAGGVSAFLAQTLQLRLQVNARTKEYETPSKLNNSGAHIRLYKEVDVEEIMELSSSNREEGYALEINEQGVQIRALEGAGLFYGVQSLLQLLPAIRPPGGNLSLDCLKVRRFSDTCGRCMQSIMMHAACVAILLLRKL